MSAPIILPRIMEVGADASCKLPDVLAALGCCRPLIVTDPMMVKLGQAQRLVDILNARDISGEVFADTVPEPTAASIVAGVERLKEGNFDAVVALGGGSPIDSAKAIAILARYGGHIREYRFPRQVNEAGLPLIAIPTTAGTGSEVTRFTIITDESTDEKLLCGGIGFMPVAALIDYRLTLSLPGRTTADTGIDALTHAIEAYVSRRANPYSDSQALAAMGFLGPNLRAAYNNGQDEVAREAMMIGATLAGIAFSNSSVALVHGMSRPIGAFFHVPHGLSNAMLLPAVTAWSLGSSPTRYAHCARVIGAASASDDDHAAGSKLIAFLESVNRDLSVPTLAEFGVKRSRFDQVVVTMAEQALASGSPGNNPQVPGIDEMVELYRGLWV
ncbi:iron-containing alcohol dehydrogenase [Pseudomonas syringae]|uniref:Iron-containing alcohol dehydrogenase n=1 Tax=Pseudomonas syringae pv. aceris TaxID=199198 RepID=A0A0L8IPS1_PSESX|nr:iron-containing alcohol dehydrogenase [Pseudomonas syringae]EGH71555.1 Iron-containing alcohol dehydrogenase [Pseudomonas syringae pv. aceris str. M302273]KOG03482.1 Iron-containing alcohol dehydrogenase [Pseudomonas syringae pv. aceris]KPW09187.1 Iron-containing alcohol dehydrogenase [Pseudomonas syringae pv. aceris]